MKILSLDSSTKILTMAINESRDVVFEIEREAEFSCNKLLFSLLKEMFEKTRISLKDIELFAVGIGPGSFTGVRVALSVMKTFSYLKNKPIIGISTLDTIASNLKGEVKELICPIMDAKREKLYSAIYRKVDEKLERISDYLLISLIDLFEKLDKDVFFLGDGVNLYRKEIIRNRPEAKIASYNLYYPKAGNLGIIAYERFKEGKVDSVFELLPLYLYPKECSIKTKN
ncbi:MAG: tRNA (adenosine(37)-N6)-threonylcarbamoyltransferase complex dimerization subunit type 1 TsaB [Candidatus Omnitrophica bacterium]|nr:tRNA (adenosine(37)-N6)-threonylcarbamoyltransferase complex dimerization subunit type 1 TsaB [Candidatus Omnitrophota bacterium]